MRLHLRGRCMTLTICICVTLPLDRVVIENMHTSYMHPIHIAFYQVYSACRLATFKGVYGTMELYEIMNAPHTHYRRRNLAKSEREHMPQTSHKRRAYAVKET